MCTQGFSFRLLAVKSASLIDCPHFFKNLVAMLQVRLQLK